MLFSIQNDLMSLVGIESDRFYFYWSSLSTLLLVASCGMAVLSALSKQEKLPSDAWIVLLSALTVFVLRFPTLTYGEANPDESQWLATVISLKNNPYHYFSNFYIYDFGRTMTIIPLWLIGLFGFEIDFGLAKIMGILFYIICVTAYYFFGKDVFDKRSAAISTSILTVYIATLSDPDYIAYNSEIPAIAFLVLFLLCFYRGVLVDKSKMYPLMAGIFAVLAFCAKLQAAYIVCVCSLFCFMAYLLSRRYIQAIFLATGVVCTSLISLMPFILFSNLNALLDWARGLIVYINYSHGQTLQEKMNFLYMANNPIYYFIPLAACVVLVVFRSVRGEIFEFIKNKAIIFILLIVFYATSLYTVVFPAYFYVHYSVFFIMPSAFVFSLLIYSMKGFSGNKILAVFCALIFIMIAQEGFFESDRQYQWRKHQKALGVNKTELSTAILQYAMPGQKMVVWGWDSSLFVDTGLLRASRYWYTWFLNPMYPEWYRKKVTEEYEYDLLKYKPELIVELINRGVNNFPNRIEAYPTIKRIIDDDYILVEKASDHRIYKLKNI